MSRKTSAEHAAAGAGIAGLRVGTSGYEYAHWKDRFYPADLPKRRWFEHYAGIFDTVEINNTFYRLPSPEVFARWQRQAPPGFEYAIKFNRYGSHRRRLRDGRKTIARFFAAARHLGSCLGPTLLQLPPHWRADAARLDEFLSASPRDVRWAVEFRDADWLNEAVFEVLRSHGAALCIHDLLPHHPRVLTADWTYLRYHGHDHGGGYSAQFLGVEARRIAALLEQGHAVYAYFNNDAEGWAVRNALALRRYLATRRHSPAAARDRRR